MFFPNTSLAKGGLRERETLSRREVEHPGRRGGGGERKGTVNRRKKKGGNVYHSATSKKEITER